MYYRYYSAVILFYIRFFFFFLYRRYCYRFVVRLIIVLSYYCRRLKTGVRVQLEYNVFFTARQRQWAHVLRLNNIILNKNLLCIYHNYHVVYGAPILYRYWRDGFCRILYRFGQTRFSKKNIKNSFSFEQIPLFPSISYFFCTRAL